jgi:hypothetical protein
MLYYTGILEKSKGQQPLLVKQLWLLQLVCPNWLKLGKLCLVDNKCKWYKVLYLELHLLVLCRPKLDHHRWLTIMWL